MAVTLTLNLQPADQDWQIYWRLKLEDTTNKLAEELRVTIRAQLPPEILAMEITPEIKERVLKMAESVFAEMDKPFKSLSRKHLFPRQDITSYGKSYELGKEYRDTSNYSQRLADKRKGSRKVTPAASKKKDKEMDTNVSPESAMPDIIGEPALTPFHKRRLGHRAGIDSFMASTTHYGVVPADKSNTPVTGQALDAVKKPTDTNS